MNEDALFEGTALKVPEILIPGKAVDLKKWAVIACDQYTQDEAYWRRVEDFARESPSALHIILPEIYLEREGAKAQIEAIKATMRRYLEGGVFAPPLKGFVYVERKTRRGRLRKGLVCAIDLERYDWKAESKAEIRATEETIASRLPPRMKIRREAALESPHIMLLANDGEKAFVEGAGEMAKLESDKPLYQTELMEGSGAITGWALTKNEHLAQVAGALSSLAKKSLMADGSRFVFAVGDGNHSLATAKALWEELKKEGAPKNHPARYALAEIVNVYDEGIDFEPIHRVLFDVHLKGLADFIAARTGARAQAAPSFDAALDAVAKDTSSFALVGQDEAIVFRLRAEDVAVATVQDALDDFLKESPAASIDYIHGSGEAERLSKGEGAVAVLLPAMRKDELFSLVAQKGSLPRKTFSLGEADEKRFYLECRKIRL